MEDINFINKFTNSLVIEENRYSCLMMAILDARKLSGRNPGSGKQEYDFLVSKNSFLNPNSFIGIISYLIILDMIGEIFIKKGMSFGKKSKNKKIEKALKQFGGSISEQDIDVIVSLRNSLAHNYGLINSPWCDDENDRKRHKFTLINDERSFLIKYPVGNKWNGDFKDKSKDSSTEVSVYNLIEVVYVNLKSDIEKNKVELALNKGVDELKARFSIMY